MKKNVLKIVIASLLLLTCGFSLSAEDAVVTYVNGKVEVSRNDKWVALKAGDKIAESETVSTGFNSEAKIKYGGSLMALGALTRITIRELSASSSKEKVDVYLNTGAVRSKVTHTNDTRVSYTVRSPVAVASVRGTMFDMLSNGEVTCFEGAVATYPVPKPKAKKAVKKAKKDKAEEEISEEESAEEENSEETPAETSPENAVEEAVEESSSGDVEGDNGPADATTPADEISDDAPAGAVVVGAGQKTTVSSDGSMEKPSDVAKKEAKKETGVVQTAAESETGVAGGNAGANEAASSKFGSFAIAVELES